MCATAVNPIIIFARYIVIVIVTAAIHVALWPSPNNQCSPFRVIIGFLAVTAALDVCDLGRWSRHPSMQGLALRHRPWLRVRTCPVPSASAIASHLQCSVSFGPDP